MVVEKWQQYRELFPLWVESYRKGNKEAKDTIDQMLKAMVEVVRLTKDYDIGMEVLSYIDEAITLFTHGTFKQLEDYAQKNKTSYGYIDLHYAVLGHLARDYFECYCFYIERDRLQKERFYEPRQKTMKQVVWALQKLENNELDRLFMHMPARVGKTQIMTFYTTWHICRNVESSNLYVTYKEGLGGAFIEGIASVLSDPTYRHTDIFPEVSIASTDAKNNKLDLCIDRRRRKKYKSISGKGLESGLNGEYDADGVLILDDILEGVQDVLSKDVLERKRLIFQNNVVPRAKENCKYVYMGTIWATDDIYMKEREFLEHNSNERIEVILIPALNDKDESNFEYEYGVGFSTKHYQMLRAKFEDNNDVAGWWCQCQQEPIDRQGQVFDPATMRYYKTLPEGEPVKIIAHCDVSLGGGDFLSFPIAYYYEENDELVGYIEDVVFDNSEKGITMPQVISKIKLHNIRNVHFESNQGGEGYKDEVTRKLKDERYRCNITSSWAQTTKRKSQRIFDAAGEIRRLYFKEPNGRSEQYRKFMNNLFGWSPDKTSKRFHEDAPDSLAGLVEFAENGSGTRVAKICGSLF